MKTTHLLTCCSLLTVAAVICGCASDKTETGGNPASTTKAAPAQSRLTILKKRKLRQPQSQLTRIGYIVANPSKIKFGEFKYVELKTSELKPEENGEGNRKSAGKN